MAKVHRKIERKRTDFAHKPLKKLVDKTDLLVFENLQIPNMVKNHHLSKSILDASWSKLIQFSSYKASNAGKRVELDQSRRNYATMLRMWNCCKEISVRASSSVSKLWTRLG